MAGELVAGLGGDADAFGAAEVEERVHAGIAAALTLAGYADVVERAGAGAEGLLNRVQAVQNIHGISVIGERAGGMQAGTGRGWVQAEIFPARWT